MSLLSKFYRDLQEWIDKGCPSHPKFITYQGICGQLDNYFPYREDRGTWERMRYELKSQFTNAGMDRIYPFGGEVLYDIELNAETLYLDPKRLQWVKDHATQTNS